MFSACCKNFQALPRKPEEPSFLLKQWEVKGKDKAEDRHPVRRENKARAVFKGATVLAGQRHWRRAAAGGAPCFLQCPLPSELLCAAGAPGSHGGQSKEGFCSSRVVRSRLLAQPIPGLAVEGFGGVSHVSPPSALQLNQ